MLFGTLTGEIKNTCAGVRYTFVLSTAIGTGHRSVSRITTKTNILLVR